MNNNANAWAQAELASSLNGLDAETAPIDTGTPDAYTLADSQGGLLDRKSQKLDRLAGRTTVKVTSMNDADTLGLASGTTLRVADSLGIRYDANEVGHGAWDGSKSQYADNKQALATAQILGKDISQVTTQDIHDVGNMQTIQAFYEMTRKPGDADWKAPLIRNSEGGQFSEEALKDYDFKVSVDGGKKDQYGRVLSNVVNPYTGVDTTFKAAMDPMQNAFAPGTPKMPRSKGFVGEGWNIVKNTAADVGGYALDAVDAAGDAIGRIGTDVGVALGGTKLTANDLDDGSAGSEILKMTGFTVDKYGDLTHRFDYQTGEEGTSSKQMLDEAFGVDSRRQNILTAQFNRQVEDIVQSDRSTTQKVAMIAKTAWNAKGTIPQAIASSYAYMLALSNPATATGLLAGTVDEHLQEVQKNNGGKQVGYDRVLGTVVGSAAELAVDLAASKLSFGIGSGLGSVNRKMVDAVAKALPEGKVGEKLLGGTINALVKKVGKGVGQAGVAVLEEGPTEGLQETLGLLMERAGTKKYDGKGIWDVLDEDARRQIRYATYQGALIGFGHSAGGQVANGAVEAVKGMRAKDLEFEGDDSKLEDVTLSENGKVAVDRMERMLASDKVAGWFRSIDDGSESDYSEKSREVIHKVVPVAIQALEEDLRAVDEKGEPVIGDPAHRRAVADKLVRYKSVRDRYLSGENGKLGSRPIDDITKDIAKTKDAGKRGGLEVEKLLATTYGEKMSSVDVGNRKAAQNEALALKMYGGVVGTEYRPGVLDYAKRISDPKSTKEEVEAAKQGFKKLIASQKTKLDAWDAGRRAWLEDPIVMEATDENGEVDNSKIVGNPTASVKVNDGYGGIRTMKYHANSGGLHRNLQLEMDVMTKAYDLVASEVQKGSKEKQVSVKEVAAAYEKAGSNEEALQSVREMYKQLGKEDRKIAGDTIAEIKKKRAAKARSRGRTPTTDEVVGIGNGLSNEADKARADFDALSSDGKAKVRKYMGMLDAGTYERKAGVPSIEQAGSSRKAAELAIERLKITAGGSPVTGFVSRLKKYGTTITTEELMEEFGNSIRFKKELLLKLVPGESYATGYVTSAQQEAAKYRKRKANPIGVVKAIKDAMEHITEWNGDEDAIKEVVKGYTQKQPKSREQAAKGMSAADLKEAARMDAIDVLVAASGLADEDVPVAVFSADTAADAKAILDEVTKSKADIDGINEELDRASEFTATDINYIFNEGTGDNNDNETADTTEREGTKGGKLSGEEITSNADTVKSFIAQAKNSPETRVAMKSLLSNGSKLKSGVITAVAKMGITTADGKVIETFEQLTKGCK